MEIPVNYLKKLEYARNTAKLKKIKASGDFDILSEHVVIDRKVKKEIIKDTKEYNIKKRFTRSYLDEKVCVICIDTPPVFYGLYDYVKDIIVLNKDFINCDGSKIFANYRSILCHELTHAYLHNSCLDHEKLGSNEIFVVSSYDRTEYNFPKDMMLLRTTQMRFNELSALTVGFNSLLNSLKDDKDYVIIKDNNVHFMKHIDTTEMDEMDIYCKRITKFKYALFSPNVKRYLSDTIDLFKDDNMFLELKPKKETMGEKIKKLFSKEQKFKDPSYINRKYVHELLGKKDVLNCFKNIGEQLFPEILK